VKILRAAGMALTGALMAVSAAVPAQADEAEVWAFLTADRPEAQGTYEPTYQNASAGVGVTVTNGTTAGTYTVNLADGGHDDGVPIVTAINAGPVHCQVAGYGNDDGDEVITVNCYNGTVLARSAFTLSFFASEGEDDLTGAYGYVRNDRPTASSYTDPPAYNSTGAAVTITRAAGTGIWTVRFLGTEFANSGGNVQVTALGTRSARCTVVKWAKDATSTGVEVQVRCQNLAGVTPQWTLGYVHERSIVGDLEDFFGYLQADQPDAPEDEIYIPDPNRNRGPNVVAHRVTRLDPGRYEVHVYGRLKEPIGVHATVNGDTTNFCVLTGAEVVAPPPPDPADGPSALVRLACYDTNGQLANSRFTLNYYAP
jgi:hypothetical protein